jgi:hypothetical protein
MATPTSNTTNAVHWVAINCLFNIATVKRAVVRILSW